MAATSLKLPEDLKQRIAKLAAAAGQTPHAFMVDTLAREAERSELRERFAADSAESEREALATGKTYPLADAFDYLESRVADSKAKRPRTRRWRASK